MLAEDTLASPDVVAKYQPVIGLEVHVQLATEARICMIIKGEVHDGESILVTHLPNTEELTFEIAPVTVA